MKKTKVRRPELAPRATNNAELLETLARNPGDIANIKKFLANQERINRELPGWKNN